MSYQIKSTPFFQRMLSISKKNGELQKLKEEYERIKDFNEKAIEVKMRQVRLKRLYREIEEIKEADLKRRRITPKDKPKLSYSSEQRLQNLSRAKAMGQSFSRHNAMMGSVDPDAGLNLFRSKITIPSKQQLRQNELEEAKRLKERIHRGCDYGNNISNWNMHKMLMGKLRNEVSQGIKETANIKANRNAARKTPPGTSEISLEGKEKLQYRITYGNTISELNKKQMPKRKEKVLNSSSNPKKTLQKPQTADSSRTLIALSDLPQQVDSGSYESCLEVQDYLVHDNGLLQPLYACDPTVIATKQKVKKRWHKLLILLKYLSESKQSKNSSAVSLDNEDGEDFSHQLRSISNDTNLLQCDVIPEYCEQLEFSEYEDEYLKNEKLLNTECLSETMPSRRPKDMSQRPTAPPTPPPPPPGSFAVQAQRLNLKPLSKATGAFNTKDEEINRFMKLYEPFSMQVVQKEIYETGVQKLLQIFEYQNISK